MATAALSTDPTTPTVLVLLDPIPSRALSEDATSGSQAPESTVPPGLRVPSSIQQQITDTCESPLCFYPPGPQTNQTNHSPRYGRHISIVEFNRAQIETLNFSPDFANTITTGMLTKLGVPLNSEQRIDLDQTNAHGRTEHDASISRLDLIQGNNAIVNPSLVQRFLEDTIPLSALFLDTASVARTRLRRERESRQAGSPPLSQVFFDSAQGEAALILLIMSNDLGTVTSQNADYRQVPKNRVRMWLLDESFPEDLGFRIPRRQVQASDNAALVKRLTAWERRLETGGGREWGPGPGYFASNGTSFVAH